MTPEAPAEKLNYVEYPAKDLMATKAFFSQAFNWEFEDYGPDYCAFSNQGLDGGFYTAEACSKADAGGALLVLLSEDIEASQAKVIAAGGTIVRDIFDFPGGRRFHFTEPSGNELAVWSHPAGESVTSQSAIDQTSHVDEENFRLIGGFNDIFIVIACALLLFSSLWATQALVNDSVGLVMFTLLSWGLSEFFIRKRNMALPAIALLTAFVGGVFALAVSLFMPDTDTSFVLASGAATIAACAHWGRFKVPVTIAVGVAAAIGVVIALIVKLVPHADNYLFVAFFLSGLLTFGLAMYWDSSDTQRLTRRSDVSFWLHLLAAPLVIHPVFSSLVAVDGDAYVLSTIIVVVCYLLMTSVSIIIDRRAFMVSSLAYVIYALGSLVGTFGSIEIGLALTGVFVGSALLLLSAFWNSVRQSMVKNVPLNIQRWVPAVK